MSKKPDVRQELANEKRELKAAVAELRGEIDETATRARKFLGAATGAAFVLKVLLELKRRQR